MVDYSLILSCLMISYNVVASSFLTWSFNRFTSTVNTDCPKVISITSPTATTTDGFATVPFILMRSFSAISLANGRRFIILDTFRNLSKRIYSLSFSFAISNIYLILETEHPLHLFLISLLGVLLH